MNFDFEFHSNGIEIIDSYKVLWSKECIDVIYLSGVRWNRSKFSLYIEWAIHTICYWLHIHRDRAKNVFFEYNGSWFKNLFK